MTNELAKALDTILQPDFGKPGVVLKDGWLKEDAEKAAQRVKSDFGRKESIVAAALRVKVPEPFASQTWQNGPLYPEYLIISAPPPARHGHLLHPIGTADPVGPDDQGFLTSRGRFVNRVEALHIANECGQPQIDHPSKNAGGHLYSEDLW